jgi:hypothetical protein
MDKNMQGKRIQLDKANQLIFGSLAFTVFIFIFALFATKDLISQGSYQNRVISKQIIAKNNLDTDLSAISSLKSSYKAFVDQPQNLLGGNPAGSGNNDGNNSKIILDALSSSFDPNAWNLNFSSLNTLLGQGPGFVSLGATSAAASSTASAASGSSSPKATPVQLSGTFSTGLNNIQGTLDLLNKPIIPIQVNTMVFTAATAGQSPTVNYTATSYYQPAYQFNIGQVIVK